MKLLKILLALYQAVIVAFSALVIFLCIYYYFRPVPNVTYHWPNIILIFIVLVPTTLFCSCSVVKLLLPARNIFARWKGLTQTSLVFTILWTILFGYLLIFQTSCRGCHTSVSKTSSLRIGQIAPDFSVKDQSGKTISLSESRGKVVLLDFWGVWCGPCRRKLPHTQEIYDKFKDKGLVVIGIHSAFRAEKTADFIAENNYTFQTGIDPGHIAKDYGVNAWPTYFLINKEGHLAWGPKHSPPLEELIESLLKN